MSAFARTIIESQRAEAARLDQLAAEYAAVNGQDSATAQDYRRLATEIRERIARGERADAEDDRFKFNDAPPAADEDVAVLKPQPAVAACKRHKYGPGGKGEAKCSRCGAARVRAPKRTTNTAGAAGSGGTGSHPGALIQDATAAVSNDNAAPSTHEDPRSGDKPGANDLPLAPAADQLSGSTVRKPCITTTDAASPLAEEQGATAAEQAADAHGGAPSPAAAGALPDGPLTGPASTSTPSSLSEVIPEVLSLSSSLEAGAAGGATPSAAPATPHTFLCPEPIRFGHLKTLGQRSPFHLTAGERDETAPMERGSALHAILLGTRDVIAYPGRRAGKDWEAFQTDNQDSLILTVADYERVIAMAESVRATPYAEAALDGVREQTLRWDFAGVPCRSTPDVRTPKRIVDLKATRSAKPEDFERQAIRSFAYHAQLAWYDESVRTLKLGTPTEHILIAVESAPPFPCVLYRLTDRALEAGHKLWRAWFERLKACRDTGLWPSYSSGRILDLDVDDPEAMPDLEFAESAASDAQQTETEA